MGHPTLRIKPPSFLFALRFVKTNEQLKFHIMQSAYQTLNTQKSHEISGFPSPSFYYVGAPRYIASSEKIPPITVLVLNLINVTGIWGGLI